MDITLNDEQQAALDSVKALGKEIESQVVNSLAIQNVGGYHLRNLAIKMNAAMQVVSPDPEVEEDDAEKTIDDVVEPNA